MTVAAYAACTPQNEHETGALLRDALLFTFLSVTEPEKVVYRTAQGRPMLTLHACDLSISHSHGIAAAALSFPGARPLPAFSDGELTLIDASPAAYRIGMDIETLADKRRARAESIAKRVFSPSEQQTLQCAPDDEAYLQRFVTIWTAKESYVKAAGVGLAGLSDADTHSLPSGFSLSSRALSLGGQPFILSVILQSPAAAE